MDVLFTLLLLEAALLLGLPLLCVAAARRFRWGRYHPSVGPSVRPTLEFWVEPPSGADGGR